MKLLGVTFDSKLSFRQHLHAVSTRACQRLGFLRKASHVLDHRGRLCAYKGFVRPVLEYAPLVWMGAAPTHLARLDRVQRRAMAIIGPQTLLQSLSHRRTVAGLTFMYKLHYVAGPPQLTSLLPQPAAVPPASPRTRTQIARTQRHPLQLLPDLSHTAPDYATRSFPHSLIELWNTLPTQCLPSPPSRKGMLAFKAAIHQHLTRTHWLRATDFR